MFHAGSSIKSQIAIISGSSIFLVFLINMYTRIAMEGNTLTSDGNNSIDINNSNNMSITELPSSMFGGGTTEGLLLTTLSSADSDRSRCRKLIMIIAKRLMKFLNRCTKKVKEVYPEQEEFTLHFDCAIKCFMIETTLIDEKRQMTNGTIKSFVEMYIPERFHELLYRLAAVCTNKYAYNMDTEDEYCKSYGRFLACLQSEADDKC